MATPGSGILIVFEGIDGVGKSTLIARLAAALTAAGEVVVESREPTDGEHGRRIRRSAVEGRMSLADELAAFVADRREHVEQLLAPALARGEVVLLDRYFYSTIAYQGARGADVAELERAMRGQFPIPDATLLLDAAPAVTLGRIAESRAAAPDEFERLEALERIRAIFLDQCARAEEMIRIDAIGEPDEVYRRVATALASGVLAAKRPGRGLDTKTLGA
ncbi:MAG: dTMP kinase [Planctomycetota bacterium]|nr:MAG: dTMP kinase [Planctomycetota bacterium]REJ87872.1 MAG: dTMP kinase [Planctomycetota bacterium]